MKKLRFLILLVLFSYSGIGLTQSADPFQVFASPQQKCHLYAEVDDHQYRDLMEKQRLLHLLWDEKETELVRDMGESFSSDPVKANEFMEKIKKEYYQINAHYSSEKLQQILEEKIKKNSEAAHLKLGTKNHHLPDPQLPYSHFTKELLLNKIWEFAKEKLLKNLGELARLNRITLDDQEAILAHYQGTFPAEKKNPMQLDQIPFSASQYEPWITQQWFIEKRQKSFRDLQMELEQYYFKTFVVMAEQGVFETSSDDDSTSDWSNSDN